MKEVPQGKGQNAALEEEPEKIGPGGPASNQTTVLAKSLPQS